MTFMFQIDVGNIMQLKKGRIEILMIVIPKYRGRLLNEVKRYPNFILFEDPKTKVKISYTYQELGYKTSQMKGKQNAESNGKTTINI